MVLSSADICSKLIITQINGSKNGSVGYTNGLINNEIKDLCENYEDSKLTLCKSYKEILEEKSTSIILLWEEILDDIDDDDKHMGEFQKSMDSS